MQFEDKVESIIDDNKKDWEDIVIENREVLTLIGYGIFVYVFFAIFFIFVPINFRTIWVLFNIVLGYAILSNDKARKYYGSMFSGFKERKVWLYSILNLGLIIGATLIPLLLIVLSGGSGGAGGNGESESNPFVSNYLFLLAVIPIIPLFADAETRIFQGWIIKGLNSSHLVECKNCGKKSLPLVKCDLCNAKLLKTEAFHLQKYMPAIIFSGFIFGLAHVLLVGSLFPLLLTIGGILLGVLYIKEGAMIVAKVHMVYNYLIITIIIIGGLL
jgi:hypothetical protein